MASNDNLPRPDPDHARIGPGGSRAQSSRGHGGGRRECGQRGTPVTGWSRGRVMVTGGGGFLGKAVVARLETEGATDIFVPRSSEYDLRTAEGIAAAIALGRP